MVGFATHLAQPNTLCVCNETILSRSCEKNWTRLGNKEGQAGDCTLFGRLWEVWNLKREWMFF